MKPTRITKSFLKFTWAIYSTNGLKNDKNIRVQYLEC
jgi:hypothetical protein